MNWKRSINSLLALLMLIIASPSVAQDEASFTPTDCRYPDDAYRYTCGFITVPEDHLVDNGKTIQLAVAIIHSTAEHPAPDPVLYLSGGPGAAFVATAPLIPTQFALNVFLTQRDVIIVDQRGMGLSQPTLNCVPFTDANDAFNLSVETYQQRMAPCLDQYAAQDLDWQAFTTEQNAADLAQIPAALGYESYNIYAHSYGTSLAQIILRDYDANLRSAILDSVVAINANAFEETALNLAAAFATIEAHCQSDGLCHWAYPDLRQTFEATYDRLQAHPVTLDISGMPMEINGRIFADFISLNMTNRVAISRLPAVITAFAENDFEIITTFLEEIVAAPVDRYPNQALLMTMVCPHQAPYTSPERITAAQATVAEPFRVVGLNASTWDLCQSWQGVPVPSRILPDSDVPTLLLAGQYDYLTPPRWARQAATDLVDAMVLEVPYTGHLTNSSTCVRGIAYAFYQAPTDPLEIACLDEIAPVGFILHTTVTRPPIQFGAVVLGGVGLIVVLLTVTYGLRDLRRTAWQMAFKKQGWLPLISLIVMLLLVWTDATVLPTDLVDVGIVNAMLPLLLAIQLSLIFSPADEPALEVQIAAGRSIIWLIAERVVVVLLTYSLIAAASISLTLALGGEQPSLIVFFGWLPAGLFLGGLGLYITIRSGLPVMGALVMAILWFVFGLFAPFFIPGQVVSPPMNLFQPFLWSIHIHASLEHLIIRDYWLNRAFLGGAGLCLLALSAYNVRDIEQLLLGVKHKSRRIKASDDINKQPLPQSSMAVPTVTTHHNTLSQIAGIARYTAMMRWRTRGMKVYILTPIAVFALFMLVAGDANTFIDFDQSMPVTQQQYHLITGEMMVSFITNVLFVPVLFMLPILVADTIPTDHRLQVVEVLNGLPTPYGVMLVGRIIGTIIASSIGLIMTFGIILALALGIQGWFYLPPLLDLLFGFLVGQGLLVALAVLLGATQRSPRLAVGLAVLVLLVPEFLQQVPFIDAIFAERISFYLMYVMSAFGNVADLFNIEPRPWSSFSDTAIEFYIVTFIHVLIVALIAWAWHHYQQTHQ